jgi:acyl-homoserine-lactone acylase
MNKMVRTKRKNPRLVYPIVFFLFAGLLFSGCARILNHHYADTVFPAEGEISAAGLENPVTIRRDSLGIPFIEAQTMEDLGFAIGFLDAADRLTQMIGLKLISQGRIAEMAGAPGVDIDSYIRTLNLTRTARILYDEMSEKNKALLEHYCNGVNAYMAQYRDRLPPGLQLSGYVPEDWKPIDSISIFGFVNLALSFNLQEEVNILNVAQKVGPEKAAWLFPIYPDEALPLAEAQKLSGIDLKPVSSSLALAVRAQKALEKTGLISVAASNNWAISKEQTAGGASIFANDTHLMLSLPSLWNMAHLKCKDFQAAGVSIPGVPGIVAGYNGHIAWGMTMVMADNQDIFLEQLKEIDGELYYLYQDKWLPAVKREEVLNIRKEEPQTITVYETIHGPLLNTVLKKSPKNPLLPQAIDLPLGLAVSWAAFEPGDKTIDAFFNLGMSRSVNEALIHARQIRSIALNMVVADSDTIAWQVTGRYPIRKKGRGLMPSPGWSGEYDWVGFLDTDEHPFSINPAEGFVGTANHRSVPADFAHTLSSSWYFPERAERIAERISATNKNSLETCMAMHRDVFSRYVAKLQNALLEGNLCEAIEAEINAWENPDRRQNAGEAMEMLRRLDGVMSPESTDAPIVGALLYTTTHNTFLDELGPCDTAAWKSLLSDAWHSYCATADHLIVRGDESPFWDHTATPEKETKAQILANSFADAIDLLEDHLGKDRADWRWGNLHTYYFETEASKMAGEMNFFQRMGVKALSSYFNRGPFPAPGDHTTLNVSAYSIAKDFDTWLIPAMRIIVDFSREEPFYAINSTGQTDNPVSPHYDDALHEWLQGNYRLMPFMQENIEKHYTRILVMTPSGS